MEQLSEIERALEIKLLIEQEKPHSLLRILRNDPLDIYQYPYETCFVLIRHSLRLVSKEEPTLWSDFDGLEQLKCLSTFESNPRLYVFHNVKDTIRIVRILQLHLNSKLGIGQEVHNELFEQIYHITARNYI